MPTTREVLEATIALERRSMALYARLAKAFAGNPRVHDFWFDMARDEARHVGALDLVSAVLELEGVLDRHSPVTLEEATVAKLDAILRRGVEAARSGIDIEQALGLALEVEETELEDKVGDLLKALQQHDEYERCMRLLVHDLGELSYMIEQYCQDPAMLQRCDELVNHHAETLRRSAVR
ncbi:MAG TPA: ferritin family protein [Candidatus Binataceae bacterium]|nr:ferritin family protein [Candidatus Binataceae bacterium]